MFCCFTSDVLRIPALDKREALARVIPISQSQVDEKRRSVVFKLDNSLRRLLIIVHDSIKERHRRTDTRHLILVIIVAIVPSIGCPIGIPEWVDKRMQGQPARDKLSWATGHQDDLLFAQQVRKRLNDHFNRRETE